MMDDVVYSSEFVKITRRVDGIYIESFMKGMQIDIFNKIISQHPEIKITSFIAVKNALLLAPTKPTKFGESRDRIVVEISNDGLKATVMLCVPENEIGSENRSHLYSEVIVKLNVNGIIFGIKHDDLAQKLCNNTQLIAAEGIAPINGEDSIANMYKFKDAKPEVKEDGKVNFYEMNLINKVYEGEWLGERIDPTPGSPGKSVKGEMIIPTPGRLIPLNYDHKTVREFHENGKTFLYSRINGALHYNADKLGVSNHLEIVKDISFNTGNIDFDGFLTVRGSIDDNFALMAIGDIEILGEYGVGSVKEIISKSGSIYIRGGIAGKNKAIIKSKKNIYTKFVSDATIICEGSVNIGFYCLNSNIVAREVILDSPKSQILGGTIKAEVKVSSAIIGSPGEKRTQISVDGFDRRLLKERLEVIVKDVERVKGEIAIMKNQLAFYTNNPQIARDKQLEFHALQDQFDVARDKMTQIEEERKIIVYSLKIKGEGEIAVMKKIHANTVITIKKITKEFTSEIWGTTFYYQDGELKQLT